MVQVTHYTDPGCPWAWSASPSLALLVWRFGKQLEWRHVMIGLTERREQYEQRGYTPQTMARGFHAFRRFGMPFAPVPKTHVSATSRACRAVVAVRLADPAREWAALRALQFLQFTTPATLDDDAALAQALSAVPGVDGAAAVAAIESSEVVEAYERDRAEARTAEGGPTWAQGKSFDSDGKDRFTAPSLIFRRGDVTLEAGGFQHAQVYDAFLANIAPELKRRGVPSETSEVLEAFPDGLTTAEVAAVYSEGAAQESDRDAVEAELIGLVAAGSAVRVPRGDDALWLAASSGSAERAVASAVAGVAH